MEGTEPLKEHAMKYSKELGSYKPKKAFCGITTSIS